MVKSQYRPNCTCVSPGFSYILSLTCIM
uniref:Uncharacterized protein n=1 Tax=Anguilla anguilla TaxID=7936 RepID=A0A0E9RAX2_ANGAN